MLPVVTPPEVTTGSHSRGQQAVRTQYHAVCTGSACAGQQWWQQVVLQLSAPHISPAGTTDRSHLHVTRIDASFGSPQQAQQAHYMQDPSGIVITDSNSNSNGVTEGNRWNVTVPSLHKGCCGATSPMSGPSLTTTANHAQTPRQSCWHKPVQLQLVRLHNHPSQKPSTKPNRLLLVTTARGMKSCPLFLCHNLVKSADLPPHR